MLSKKTGKYFITTAKVRSGNKQVMLRFFNMPYLKNILQPSSNYILRGILNVKKDKNTGETIFSMLQPKIYEVSKYQELMGHLSPVYSLTKGMTNKTIQKSIEHIWTDLEEIKDYLTIDACKDMELVFFPSSIPSINPSFICLKQRRNTKWGVKGLHFMSFLCFCTKCRRIKRKLKLS